MGSTSSTTGATMPASCRASHTTLASGDSWPTAPRTWGHHQHVIHPHHDGHTPATPTHPRAQIDRAIFSTSTCCGRPGVANKSIHSQLHPPPSPPSHKQLERSAPECLTPCYMRRTCTKALCSASNDESQTYHTLSRMKAPADASGKATH
jgi:hypothetical protein